MNWFFYSLASALAFTAYFLLIKRLGNLNIPAHVMMIFTSTIALLFLASFFIFKREKLVLQGSTLILLIVLGIISMLGTLLIMKAVPLAPNPGYATAIGSLQIMLVALISWLVFKSDFSLIKVAGTILIIVGTVLLAI